MSPSAALRVTLVPHPASAAASVRRLHASLSRSQRGLTIRFVLEGALDALHVPLTHAPDATGPLWQHTCFEVFVAREESAAYHELNFAADGRWAGYVFERYRGAPRILDDSPRPEIAVRKTRDALELGAQIPLASLSDEYVDAGLALGVCAVIEDTEGVLSHWALAHPAAKPDFHHRGGFIVHV